MKYELSKCVVEQLSENIFQVTPHEGIVVDKNYLDEIWKLWDDLRDKQFGVLINCKNQFSRSFEGARDTGKHHLNQKVAFLCKEDDYHTKKHWALTKQIKKMTAGNIHHQFFTDRDEAIKWLSDI